MEHAGSYSCDAGRVADPSAITRVVLGIAPLATQMRVGTVVSFTPTLLDAQGAVFRALPTGWVVGSPSILSLRASPIFPGAFEIRGLAQGTTQLTAMFRDVTASVTITIAP